jgi:hypothetical protein
MTEPEATSKKADNAKTNDKKTAGTAITWARSLICDPFRPKTRKAASGESGMSAYSMMKVSLDGRRSQTGLKEDTGAFGV